MKVKSFILLILFVIMSIVSYSQQLFYQDVFYGGVTGGGFSSGSNNGSANGQIIVNINPSSTIKKAFLFCNRYEIAIDLDINFNSNIYTFDSTNQVGYNYFIIAANSNDSCAVHAIDVTNEINPSQNTYNISYLSQPTTTGNFNKYSAFYLLVIYESSILPRTAISVVLNNRNMTSNVVYPINNILPIDTLNPVGLAIHSDIIWNTGQDGSNIFVNGNNIGLIGGSDAINSTWIGGGVKGHFYYENNSLFGLDDDTPDSLMSGTDGLADIKSYVNYGATSLTTNLIKQPTAPYNVYLAFFLTYTTPCDTFSTSITPNDTICFGDSVQLNATGGSLYSWFGAFGGLNDTSIANPKASPPQTTTYIVTITNDSGCVKTEHVKIWVNPLPVADTLIVTNNVCGDSVGSIQVGNIPNGTAPFTYSLTNLITLNTQNSTLNTFTNLGTGTYEILITDANGCLWLDTVTVNEVNNVNANFTATPQSGVAPLDVTFSNISAGANNYEWTIINNQLNDTIIQYSSFNIQHLFDSAGTYQVCLVAFNNLPRCADTICKTIIVEDEISLIIPNVFTPNFDGDNDNFVIQLSGVENIKKLSAEVFNRWGMLVVSNQFVSSQLSVTSNQQLTIWNGYTTAAAQAPEGTYFYVITYQTLKGVVESKKGSVSLLR